MADFLVLSIDGVDYTIKDATARESISGIVDDLIDKADKSERRKIKK